MSYEKRPHVRTERVHEFMSCKINLDIESNGQKLLRCPKDGCDKILTSTPGLRYHLKKHLPQQHTFTCYKCNKVFKSYNGMKYHSEKNRCEKTLNTVEEEDSDFESSQDHNSVSNFSHYYSDLEEPTDLDCIRPKPKQHPNWLAELATIATSPESPLVQITSKSSLNFSSCFGLHNYARPFTAKEQLPISSEQSNQVSSTSSINGVSDLPSDWSHSWPEFDWQCFIKGSFINFLYKNKVKRTSVEILSKKESLSEKALQGLPENKYAPNGLTLLEICGDLSDKILELRFTPEFKGQPEIIAEVPINHPFFVKDKGWRSCDPVGTDDQYGIPCTDLSVGDICLAPNHPDASSTENIMKTIKRYDFTPMDSTAVFALSSMASQKKKYNFQNSISNKFAPKEFKVKTKRPMNAFMLYARKYRMELMHNHPEKDNRSISVLLGDNWKKLKSEEKKAYHAQAKKLAACVIKSHPDCWKTKHSL